CACPAEADANDRVSPRQAACEATRAQRRADARPRFATIRPSPFATTTADLAASAHASARVRAEAVAGHRARGCHSRPWRCPPLVARTARTAHRPDAPPHPVVATSC